MTRQQEIIKKKQKFYKNIYNYHHWDMPKVAKGTVVKFLAVT
jgi:hypothetical protein